MRKLVYYVAASLDGFIADQDGDTSRFPIEPETLNELFARYPETCPCHLREVLSVKGEPRRFDTVLMGVRTHEPALDAGLTSAYPHLRQIVVTHRELPMDPTVERWEGNVAERVRNLKTEPGKDIWLCGGGSLAGQLLDQIDELQLKINPVTLGNGVPLFTGSASHTWTPTSIETLPGGIVLASYSRAKR
ncbi:dihydrofolate reductase family protein [Micrococcus yunnanensis]|uniref:dihydrofolate reductase family protein n=1 Tax=Micrococcus yunnanensis TaxID=566027 RepID=UPI001F1A3B64|nr:dihydrofolate reductase family protein [Micrococcus yunnanensis]MCF8560581.1 dihydrofolate reductase family protein [Micrococcus yunnanensis]MCV7684960.1 dihydrofolate reductase family protein [Micrococcus luteus]MCV7732156.1 dihydrofolate reductase family protein [Micrococcus luteus]